MSLGVAAHIAQLVEHSFGKGRGHRFKSGYELHFCSAELDLCVESKCLNEEMAMAKAAFERKKPHVNVGTITTLTTAKPR